MKLLWQQLEAASNEDIRGERDFFHTCFTECLKNALDGGEVGTAVWLLDVLQRAASPGLSAHMPWGCAQRGWRGAWCVRLWCMPALRRLWELGFQADALPWRALLDGTWPEVLGELHASQGAPLPVGLVSQRVQTVEASAACPC
jgi:hypothetical protein